MVAGVRTGTISIGFSGWTAGGILPRSVARQHCDRTLVTPFDKAMVPAIVRALNQAHLNADALNPSTVSVSVPPLSGEQRAEIARHIRRLGEDAKVAVRAIRQEARQRMGGYCTEGSRRRPMQREPRICIRHGSWRESCRLEPILFRGAMG